MIITLNGRILEERMLIWLYIHYELTSGLCNFVQLDKISNFTVFQSNEFELWDPFE